MLGLMDLNQCAIIIQARMSSSRFSGKMMSSIWNNMPLIEYVYRRCKRSSVKNILVATSTDASDDLLYEHCQKNNILATRGDLNNVLRRYVQAGEFLKIKYIVRVCGDTPFVDVSLIDILLDTLICERLDYVSFDRETCSSGFYSEAVTLQALKRVEMLTKKKEDLEHVTKFILNQKDKFQNRLIDIELNPEFVRKVRLTIDYPEDIQTAKLIIEELKDKFFFTSKEILNIVAKKELQLCI